MTTSNPVTTETVFFDEAVKGDRLLVTSGIISYRGTTINTPSVNQLTRISFTQSVNYIPSAAQFRIGVASPDAEIMIDFARLLGGAFWLGKGQFVRVGSAFFDAVGRRLIAVALQRLQAGETLVWRHKPSSFEKDSTVRLSRTGLHIQQTGVILNKDVSIPWPLLKFTHANGSSKFRNYKTGERATIGTWRMRDNVTFQAVVGFLVDKANYRMLEV